MLSYRRCQRGFLFYEAFLIVKAYLASLLQQPPLNRAEGGQRPEAQARSATGSNGQGRVNILSYPGDERPTQNDPPTIERRGKSDRLRTDLASMTVGFSAKNANGTYVVNSHVSLNAGVAQSVEVHLLQRYPINSLSGLLTDRSVWLLRQAIARDNLKVAGSSPAFGSSYSLRLQSKDGSRLITTSLFA